MRAFGSVMPGRLPASTRALPFVSFTPTPIRFANCFAIFAFRSSQWPAYSFGSRDCQSGRSPPCPSASIT